MGLPELMVLVAEPCKVPVHWCAPCQQGEHAAASLHVSKHWDGWKSPPALYPPLNFAHKEMADHGTMRLSVLSTAPAALWLLRATRFPWAGMQGSALGLHQPRNSLHAAFRPQILHLHFLLTTSPRCQWIISVWVPLNKTFICSPSPRPQQGLPELNVVAQLQRTQLPSLLQFFCLEKKHIQFNMLLAQQLFCSRGGGFVYGYFDRVAFIRTQVVLHLPPTQGCLCGCPRTFSCPGRRL